MAAAGYTQSADGLQALKAQIKRPGLTVPELKNILRDHNLPVSGIKSELQIRLISYVEKLHNSGDARRIDRVKGAVSDFPGPYNRKYPSPHTPAPSASPQSFYSPHLKQSGNASYGMAPSRTPFNSSRLNFPDSPFYRIVKPLTDPVECKARESTRDTARVNLVLSRDLATLLQQDENQKVMIFCTTESLTGGSKSDIAFPHQVELKCNDQEVKGNLRGLKNKPGSTRPADITSLLRKKIPDYKNTVEMVYALTTKGKQSSQKYYLVINQVLKKSVDMLVADLKRGKFISKEQVLREMQKQASDNDIEATSSVMSLKCPLSFTRLRLPCRGIGCRHNQCFDATSYLQLQEQAPTWQCPVCNKAVTWENLVLDQYVQDILQSTAQDTEQVVVEPDGKWSTQSAPQQNTNGRTSNPTPTSDDDDDLVVVNSSTTAPTSNPFQALTPSSVRTPPIRSREDSAATSSATRSNKRPRREVIDLTLSDDDEPPRPTKRPSTTTNSLSQIASYTSTNGNSSASPTMSFRARPPEQSTQQRERYQFHLPPPGPSMNFNYDSRFGQPSALGGGGPSGSSSTGSLNGMGEENLFE